ncbi:hypothetical protein BDY21DRAFT_342465 [Lineolata rhizophorae]|uniref:Uncharacterized protein n=1 Tax=Lineolata rhizophorae TaxID=578093 RepID=A0A6A6P314_9PEZI|nr:hypothetical protein BDY21DRAFT_342465 [Lineolata rhizophorae]
MKPEREHVPYWLANVPKRDWPAECPPHLRGLSDKDKKTLSTRDADFRRLSWAEVKEIIGAGQLGRFARLPSDLRRYRHHIWEQTNRFGSISAYIVKEVLAWSDLTPKAGPFQHPNDIQILLNNWPYYIDAKVVHFVVWHKFRLDEDSTGQLTSTARKQVLEFMASTFYPRIPPENVTWFRNTGTLKSVDAVEHFHVMVYDADPAFVEELLSSCTS